MPSSRKFMIAGVTALAVGVAFFALTRSHHAEAEATDKGAAPPPAIVSTMREENVDVWKNFTGRLRAVDYVEIRPEVSGKITAIKFNDGEIVKKGAILFVIDPAPYQAAVEKARADLNVANNQSVFAQKEMDRAQDLIKTDAISRKIYDERKSAAEVAKSQVQSARAQLDQAQINLGYAYVKAPISGRISRAEITEGNLVSASGSAPILTTIVSDAGIYADFDVDEQTYLQDIYPVARDTESQLRIPVEIALGSGGNDTHKGVIESFDNKIDPQSGTIRVRAFLENADQALLPGMFVNIRLGSVSNEPRLLVSETAIGTDQDRKFVYVIGAGNKVVYREVKLGASIEGKRIVISGLQPGEKVITEGIIKIRPDMVVTPKEDAVKQAALTAPAAAPVAEPKMEDASGAEPAEPAEATEAAEPTAE